MNLHNTYYISKEEISMNLFVLSKNGEYILQPAGYAAAVILLLAVLLSICAFRKGKVTKPMRTRELVFCSVCIALATVTSFIKFASLPYGGSVTLFSMLFISMTGYFFGLKTGLTAGAAYGILSFIISPYIYAPVQLLLDYPLAFAALGLSGLFSRKKHGLIIGYIVGVTGRYIFHVISGYVFFAAYAPDNMDPMVYTLAYNLTYILPEMIITVIILCIPTVQKSFSQLKQQLTRE